MNERAGKMRGDQGDADQQQLERLRAELKTRMEASSRLQEPMVSLWPHELAALLEVLDRALDPPRRGRPESVAGRARWIAIHFWYLRCSGKTALEAALEVADSWRVSDSLVAKYGADHKEAAIETVGVLLAGPEAAAVNIGTILQALRNFTEA